MNKNFLLYAFTILIFFSSTFIFSQSKIVTGMYHGEYQKYYKDKLILAYLPDSVNNIDYIHKVNDFIRKHNGSIDWVISILQYSQIEITLYSYNTDAVDFLDVFKNSGLFEYVSLYGIIEPNMIKSEDQNSVEK